MTAISLRSKAQVQPLAHSVQSACYLSVQFSSVAQLCLTLCDPMDCSTPGFPVHHQLPELTETHVHQVSDAIQPSHPLSSPSSSAFSLSQHQGLFQWVIPCIRWSKYWSCSFSIRPSSEYSGLIPFRIDQFDLLAVQRTLKSLHQHHSSKASVFRSSAFFMIQLSHPYMTTGKTIALTRRTFVGKVMSLLFTSLPSPFPTVPLTWGSNHTGLADPQACQVNPHLRAFALTVLSAWCSCLISSYGYFLLYFKSQLRLLREAGPLWPCL